jgi:predicted DNA-binding protein YlxM (UPF0122 family)
MPRGKKTSIEKKEAVKAVIYLNPEASCREIAKDTGISHTTINDIRKECEFELRSDEYLHYRSLKKKEFIDKAFSIALQGLDVAKLKFDSLQTNPEALQKANVRDVAVALGTIYDKQALAMGEPTEITDSKEPTPELVENMQIKLDKLKQLISKSG